MTSGILDKTVLIGACARLPLQVDSARLQQEVASLSSLTWGASGRVGVHRAAEAVFLRGYAPAEGDRPIDDRDTLRHMPYARYIIEQLIPATPMRCLLARLAPGKIIASHIDRADYFTRSIRLHVPVTTHEQAFMFCAGQTYHMREGEVWALNNSANHGVWNAHESMHRTHLICDFTPSPELTELLARSDRSLGVRDNEVSARLTARLEPQIS